MGTGPGPEGPPLHPQEGPWWIFGDLPVADDLLPDDSGTQVVVLELIEEVRALDADLRIPRRYG